MSAALALGVCAPAVSAAVVALLLRYANRLPVDTPNARSLHERIVPRGGGLAIWAGFLPAAIAAPPTVPGPWSAWLAGIALVAAVSFADDLRGVPVALRLAVHSIAALAVAALIAAGTGLGWPLLAAMAVAIVAGSNLYNFMDGSDGLAASMSVSGFAAYAMAAAYAGVPWLAFAALALAGVPFLVANLPPARIFMGDVGAVPLGFLATSCGIAGVVQGFWPGWFPLLVFIPFLADASLTLARRTFSGQRVWEAHRSHYYQRLNASGAGHRGTLAIYGAAMLACAAVALACLVLAPSAGWSALAVAAGGHLAGFFAIDYHQRNMTSRGR